MPKRPFKTFNPEQIPVRDWHRFMLSSIAPRPIAFVSSKGKDGSINLAPYSFFNAFGSNPPTLVFSPARRGRDNTTKDTLKNVEEHPECVVNIVNYAIAEQMSLASAGFDYGVSEFEKAGFTELESETIAVPRVAESPVNFECKVKDIVYTGEEGGAGNLVICEVQRMHIQEYCIVGDMVDPQKIDLVGRMGGDFYVRASGDAVFDLPGLKDAQVIGIDALPEEIKTSDKLTGRMLARLGANPEVPSDEEVKEYQASPDANALFGRLEGNLESDEDKVIQKVDDFIFTGHNNKALLLLMAWNVYKKENY